MRVILGQLHKPDSSYILVLRGLDEEAMSYFCEHEKKYPTWGCLLFPDIGEELKEELSPAVVTPIHRLYVDADYTGISDKTLLKWIKERFPPFSEDAEDDMRIKEPPLGIRKLRTYHAQHKLLETSPLRLAFEERISLTIEECKKVVLKELFASPFAWDIQIVGCDMEAEGSTTVIVKLNVSENLEATSSAPR